MDIWSGYLIRFWIFIPQHPLLEFPLIYRILLLVQSEVQPACVSVPEAVELSLLGLSESGA